MGRRVILLRGVGFSNKLRRAGARRPRLRLNLSDVFAIAYERGRYAPNLYYRQPPPAPLRKEDVPWARKLARSFQSRLGQAGNGKV